LKSHKKNYKKENEKTSKLRDYFIENFIKEFPNSFLNGPLCHSHVTVIPATSVIPAKAGIYPEGMPALSADRQAAGMAGI